MNTNNCCSNIIGQVVYIYTMQPKVFQNSEFPRMPFKASIILVKSHNYIIKCLKISSNIVRVVYHVISGHVRKIHVKWHMCLYHVAQWGFAYISVENSDNC